MALRSEEQWATQLQDCGIPTTDAARYSRHSLLSHDSVLLYIARYFTTIALQMRH